MPLGSASKRFQNSFVVQDIILFWMQDQMGELFLFQSLYELLLQVQKEIPEKWKKSKLPVNHVQLDAQAPWGIHSKAVNHPLVFHPVNRLVYLRKPSGDTSKALIR